MVQRVGMKAVFGHAGRGDGNTKGSLEGGAYSTVYS